MEAPQQEAAQAGGAQPPSSDRSHAERDEPPPADGGGDQPKRKSRWGAKAEDEGDGQRKKSRWGSKDESAAPAVNPIAVMNPEQAKVQQRLNEIQRLMGQPSLDTAEMVDRYDPDKQEWITVEGGRSPSPEPQYDRSGKRTNTRDMRLRDKLQRERLALVEKLMTLQPNAPNMAQFKFTSNQKKQNKIWVPVKEYPGYPFIGLILGPRGNTQKKLERETGARIVIRGKGSVKDGRRGFRGNDPSEDEDLHVLITADTQEQVDAASKVICELLQPKEDSENEWKRMQLRELAMINGTLRDDQDFFKDEMRQLARTQQGGPGGATADAPWRLNADLQEQQMERDWQRAHGGGGGGPPPPSGEMDNEYSQFMDELGGGSGGGRGGGGGGGGGGGAPPWASGGGGGGGGSGSSPYGPPGGGGSMGPYGPRDGGGRGGPGEMSDTNLYVGGLPAHVDDGALRQMFSGYGEVTHANVIKDKVTGMSRNFGFVNFTGASMAQSAIQGMNGRMMEGKTLQVRLKGAPASSPMGGSGPPGGAPPWARGGGGPPGGMPPSPYGPPPGRGGGYGPPPSGGGGPPPWGGPPRGPPGGGPPPPGQAPYGGYPPGQGAPPPPWGGPPPPGGGYPPPPGHYPPQQDGGYGQHGYPPPQDPYAQQAGYGGGYPPQDGGWGQGQPPPPQGAPPGGSAPLDNEYAQFMSETS